MFPKTSRHLNYKIIQVSKKLHIKTNLVTEILKTFPSGLGSIIYDIVSPSEVTFSTFQSLDVRRS